MAQRSSSSRNTDLDARGFFPRERPTSQNQFGGTFGAPIKIFFFGDYQGTQNIQGIGTGLLPVPSLADRSGNLSDLASALTGTVQGAYAASLLTQRLGYGVSPGEAYYAPGCTLSSNCVFPNAVIPERAWSAPAQNLLQYIPQPNVEASEYANASLAQHLNDGKGSVRMDAPSTRLGVISAYYFIDNYNLNNPYPTQQGGANVPGFNALSNGQAQLASLSDTKTFRPTLVNVFQLSYLRDFNNLGQQQEASAKASHRRDLPWARTALLLETPRLTAWNRSCSTRSISGPALSRFSKPTGVIRRRTICPR